MNTKIIITIVGLVLVAGAYGMLWNKGQDEVATDDQAGEVNTVNNVGAPDMAMALKLMKDDLPYAHCSLERVEGAYAWCRYKAEARGGPSSLEWLATFTYDGFYDDSIRGSQISAVINKRSGAWQKTAVSSEAVLCWPNRGHQSYHPTPCV